MIELRISMPESAMRPKQRHEAEGRMGEVERKRRADEAKRRAHHHQRDAREVLKLEHHDP